MRKLLLCIIAIFTDVVYDNNGGWHKTEFTSCKWIANYYILWRLTKSKQRRKQTGTTKKKSKARPYLISVFIGLGFHIVQFCFHINHSSVPLLHLYIKRKCSENMTTPDSFLQSQVSSDHHVILTSCRQSSYCCRSLSTARSCSRTWNKEIKKNYFSYNLSKTTIKYAAMHGNSLFYKSVE